MAKFGFTASNDSDDTQYEESKEKVMRELKNYFRPEFLNRLDEIIIFNILSTEAMKEIVKIQTGIVAERLAAKDIKLSVSAEALTALAREGHNPSYGARPLKRLIQTKILTPIASMMVSKGVMEGGRVIVDYVDGEFRVSVRKKQAPRKRTTQKRATAGSR